MGIDVVERCFSKGGVIFCSGPIRPEGAMPSTPRPRPNPRWQALVQKILELETLDCSLKESSKS